MSNELEILSNDLKIYFRGFEVALGKKEIPDAVRYLKEMRKEVDENLEFLTHTYAGAPKEVAPAAGDSRALPKRP